MERITDACLLVGSAVTQYLAETLGSATVVDPSLLPDERPYPLPEGVARAIRASR